MVYPASGIIFKINTAGRATPGTFVVIKDVESFEPTFSNKVESWTPFDTEGWERNLTTGKGIKIAIKGKRNEGDPGNDYVADKTMDIGEDANSILEMTFPNGDKLTVPCVVDTKSIGGGKSTEVSQLESDFVSDGKPTYVPHTVPLG